MFTATMILNLNVNKDEFLVCLEQAFYFNMIISYAQGMHLFSSASDEYKYDLKLGRDCQNMARWLYHPFGVFE